MKKLLKSSHTRIIFSFYNVRIYIKDSENMLN